MTARSYREVVSAVEEKVASLRGGRLFIFLGGDHSITYATLRALRSFYRGRLGLVYLDAHPDLYDEYEGDRYSHACTLRRIVEEGFVDPRDVILAGVRAATPSQLDFAEKAGITVLGVEEAEDLAAYLKEGMPYYISYDLDVLDPAYAPGVGNPEPGGLSTREMVRIIKSLPEDVLAFDVVEASPPHDPSGLTLFTAAKIIRETLARARPPGWGEV